MSTLERLLHRRAELAQVLSELRAFVVDLRAGLQTPKSRAMLREAERAMAESLQLLTEIEHAEAEDCCGNEIN